MTGGRRTSTRGASHVPSIRHFAALAMSVVVTTATAHHSFAPHFDASKPVNISGTELRKRLSEGRDIPECFTFPEVVQELRRTHPPRKEQGFTVFFTGLSGAGKSTIANVLLVKLLERGGRPVTLLDGDVVRKHLSSELGFSKEHRDINIRRIGYVASEITKNEGIAICAPIAPYDSVRKEVRAMIEPMGGFLLIHLATPLDICEGRDRKDEGQAARPGAAQRVHQQQHAGRRGHEDLGPGRHHVGDRENHGHAFHAAGLRAC